VLLNNNLSRTCYNVLSTKVKPIVHKIISIRFITVTAWNVNFYASVIRHNNLDGEKDAYFMATIDGVFRVGHVCDLNKSETRFIHHT